MSETTVLDPSRPLGELAVALPGATAVFRRHQLDYCCGGQQTLGEAARAQQLDIKAVLAELAALDPVAAPETFASASVLIDHILTRFHEVHRAQLPELIALAERVEHVHRDHPQAPAGLAQRLRQMLVELETHMMKEEEVLFPMLRQGGNPFVKHPIAVMRDEHDDHGRSLEHLAALTHDGLAPADACTTWLALYAGVRVLIDDLMQHIHLENNVLFPMFLAAEASEGCGAAGGCSCR
ncbi:iron-sulfur cluster repair protein YtfE [Chitinibacteraceae bacterium HSL-7]